MTVVPTTAGVPEPPSGGAPEAVEGGQAMAPGSLWRNTLRTFGENRLAVLGLSIIVFVVLFCYLGPVFYHTDQVHTNLDLTSTKPSAKHLLGTDDLGYDELGRLMVSGQNSLEVGLAAAAVASLFGIVWGAVAGWFGGFVDAIMMRIVDTVLSIPLLFLLLLVSTMFTETVVTLIFIIAAFAWLIPARLVRGEVLSLRTREFVQAARIAGGRSPRIILRHLLPNSIGVIVVQVTFEVANAILAVSALSYLGFGLQAPTSDWGGMLANGVTYLYDGYWWEYLPAGIAIVLVVIAFNFVGDALRDALDIRLRQQ